LGEGGGGEGGGLVKGRMRRQAAYKKHVLKSYHVMHRLVINTVESSVKNSIKGSLIHSRKTIERRAVLRIQIRNPVLLDPLDLGSGMGKNQRSGSRMNIQDHIFESLDTIILG
jgi:hypothetical protein